jgi:stearoyl-CoA desaturase (delta-9 desaturase)
MFIDFFAWIGWAYDLKTVPEKILRDRFKRTGDGTHERFGDALIELNGHSDKEPLPAWGWGDKDIPQEHFHITELVKQKIGL